MKDRLLAVIDDAIEFEREIVASLESGTNAISVCFVPDAIYEGVNNIIIYSGSDIFSIDASNIQYIDELDEFICHNETSIITISY